ncbi:MAG: methyltransferase domain-containing protein [Pseudomonadota bacterium]|uniref:methyltransferase domain-containing protein n=1 Tax=Rhizorhabdus phycosphaerae TaxID=2711156 RepID=UPI0013EBFFE4|nr:methyltransferase domain-containing protein [Rhizorhabdus phycosphaerae]
MDQPEIFDRRLRRLRRNRAAQDFAAHDFLIDHMASELAERLAMVTRRFDRALLLGCHDGRLSAYFTAPDRRLFAADPGFAFARASGGIQCDEDRLPFADGSFDLIVALGTLDGVNDLPGALSLARRALRPDGLFLGAFLGAGSLSWLRGALMEADEAAGGGVAPRIHPQVDVRSAGDLLSRAGFALPVADGERLDVGYGDPIKLLHDLRGMAGGNILLSRPRHLSGGRAWLGALFEAFQRATDPDGRVRERFEIVYLSGWAPDPGQPKPARRGSATASLADALRAPKPR